MDLHHGKLWIGPTLFADPSEYYMLIMFANICQSMTLIQISDLWKLDERRDVDDFRTVFHRSFSLGGRENTKAAEMRPDQARR